MKSSSSFIRPVLNTYAILFFSQNKVLGALLLLVSFLNPLAGLSALCCALFSLALTSLLGYQKDTIQSGIYSFNSLLLGLAFGAFYRFNLHYVLWLAFTCLLVIMVTIILAARLGKLGLPILSLPFILCFWLLLLSSGGLFSTGLLPGNSLVLHAVYGGAMDLHNYLSTNLPSLLCLFFRSLSAVLFQDNIITGMVIGIGLLIHSRIAFSLAVIGFIAAYGFNAITHIYPGGISYYHLGANFMMSTIAIGSFFTIPSGRSYLWAIACIPLLFIFTNAFTGLLAAYNLPVLSLPFCVINITLLYFLLLRQSAGKLQLVALQHYSPERNLYQYINQSKRLSDLQYFRFHLPFMGEWTVSQGYDSTITHKADWGKALDFVISDEENKTYALPGLLPEHFYCYNKPVLACGDGVVVNVTDHVEDNAIGRSNTRENWGNTVVIKHLEGLYSKVSHLKKSSIKVALGQVVKQGDQLGLCGNSGRSPEPHLHFQVQASSYIDAKTIAYPFAWYMSGEGGAGKLKSFNTPAEGDKVKPADIDNTLKKAFDLQPGYTAAIMAGGKSEFIEVFTDELGQSYIYCKTTGALAYFINNGTLFYFTSFYGDTNSLLYHFYLAAYKVVFSNNQAIVVADDYPLQLYPGKLQLCLQDVIAPFHRFLKLSYQAHVVAQKGGFTLQAAGFEHLSGTKKQIMDADILISGKGIQEFSINIKGQHIQARWVKEGIY